MLLIRHLFPTGGVLESCPALRFLFVLLRPASDRGFSQLQGETCMTTTNNAHDATITIPDTKSAASDLDTLDFGWTDDDRVVVPIMKMARLRWLNGAATDEQTMAIGSHIESASNPLIDETLEGM